MPEADSKKNKIIRYLDAAQINAREKETIPLRYHWILWCTVALIVFTLLWAHFAEIDDVTTGSGKVIPSSKIQVVQHLEGGIIRNILVKEGDKVTRGQVLILVDNTHYGALSREGELKAAALIAKIARLTAESRGEAPKIDPDFHRQFPKLSKRELDVFMANSRDEKARITGLEQQVKQKQQELEAAKSKAQRIDKSHALVAKELEMTQSLLAEGATSQVEVLRLERQSIDMQGEFTETKLLINQLSEGLIEVKNRVNELQSQRQSHAAHELATAQAELAALGASNKALDDRAKRTVIRSPVSGTVKVIHVSTVGGSIRPGMDLIEIVPSEDSLLVEAQIQPANVAFLRPQQEVLVKISAYDFVIYGGLKGKIEHISADTIKDERGNSFYLIRIRTDKNYIGEKSKRMMIIPGMTAQVSIITGKRSILHYILKPFLRGQNGG